MRMRGLPFGMGVLEAKRACAGVIGRPGEVLEQFAKPRRYARLSARLGDVDELGGARGLGAGVEVADADLQPKAPGGQGLDGHRDELPPQRARLLFAARG